VSTPSVTHIDVGGATVEVFASAPVAGSIAVCAAHPFGPMLGGSVTLLEEASGARIVCANPRGVGGSSPASPPYDSSFEAMTDDLERVRQALGISRWVFWGMSGGVYIGQMYAARHPSALAGLILEGAGSSFREIAIDPACVVSPLNSAWRAQLAEKGLLGEMTIPDGAETEWTELTGTAWVFRRRGGPALFLSPSEPPEAMRRTLPVLWRFDARGWLGAIRTPTLVIGGTADPIAPIAHLRALHQAIPGSELVEVEGAGHVPVTERRDEVGVAVRRFLSTRVGL
jgi:3-oxoadipate enol-lactonase